MTKSQIWLLISTIFHAIGFTIDYPNGLYSCYIVGDAIGHAIRYIIDYTNEKAIDMSMGNYFTLSYAIEFVICYTIIYEICLARY